MFVTKVTFGKCFDMMHASFVCPLLTRYWQLGSHMHYELTGCLQQLANHDPPEWGQEFTTSLHMIIASPTMHE